MVNSVNIHGHIAISPDIAKLQNIEQQRDKVQTQQMAFLIQKETINKETQIQESKQTDYVELQTKRKEKDKGNNKGSREGKKHSNNRKPHVDLKAD